jgi:hypothetical protein
LFGDDDEERAKDGVIFGTGKNRRRKHAENGEQRELFRVVLVLCNVLVCLDDDNYIVAAFFLDWKGSRRSS